MRFLPNAKRAWLLQRLPWDVALPLHEGLEAIVGMTSSFTVAALLRNPQVRGRLSLCRLPPLLVGCATAEQTRRHSDGPGSVARPSRKCRI